MKNRHTAVAIIMLYTSLFIQAQEIQSVENPVTENSLPVTNDPLRLFITGNIYDKTTAVSNPFVTPDAESSMLPLMAVDYVIEYVPILGTDLDFLKLTYAAVNTMGTPPGKQAVPRLNKLFRLFSDDALRTAILEKLSYYVEHEPQETGASITLANAFLTESLKPSVTVGQAQLAAIKMLGKAGSQSSFSILFSYILRGQNAQLSTAAEQSLNTLLPNGMQNIIRILAVNPSSEKIQILKLINKNAELTDTFKAEVATKALEKTIYNTEDISWVDQELIQLHLEALQMLSNLSWTKAAEAVMQLFLLARKEYESGCLSEKQFVSVIEQTAQLAADQAAPVLTAYLNALNKETEEKGLRSESVVLAVINALGALGDKTAFDYLLYVTYLSYPETVIEAARSALAGLKW